VRKAQRGEVDVDGNIVVEDVPEEDLEGDPSPDPPDDGAQRRTIEVDFVDDDGNIRTIRIEYLEHPQEEDE
ncbi:MAG: hypothetical protein HQ568_02720, partial [Calditrichaeota bacterium]|nr:hypothetical protein [Calditrichota bacterium]